MTEQSSHSQPKQRHRGASHPDRLGIAGRFEMLAAPSRRALQGRMGYLRNILIVLSVVTIGIVAYAQWLAWHPSPYPQATLAALNRARFEDAFATATETPTALPTTPTPIPTASPEPKPTNTLVPLPTRKPKAQPTDTQQASSPTPIPAPILVAPVDGVTALERMFFEWAWEGSPLKDNQAFDLRIWSLQEEEQGKPRRGVMPLTRDTRVEVSLPAVPAILDYGSGSYFWTVITVELSSDGSPVRMGSWGEIRRLEYP